MNVKIRELSFDDIDFNLEIENDREIWKVSNTQQEFTNIEIEHFIAKNTIDGLNDGQKRWVITKDDINVGLIDIFDFDDKNKHAGLGIVIHKKYRNKGIAKSAISIFIPFAREKLNLHQLYCTIIADNIHSIKLFTKLGFKESGVRKDWTFYDGKYYNEIFYQLIL